jgi:hypothetical protein
MKKVSTAAMKQTHNFGEQKLTIGLDLGDRSSWYCMLDGSGAVLLEQKLGTTPKAMQEGSEACRGAGSPWKPGCIHRGSAGYCTNSGRR